MDLLFSPDRDFLLKNNGHKVRVDDLNAKTIVLYIVPLLKTFTEPFDTLDMIEAYNELMPMGDVEFVFVAVQIVDTTDYFRPSLQPEEEEAYFNNLFSTLPFPTIPFSDKPARDRVVDAFRLDSSKLSYSSQPYWSIIDPTNTVVASKTDCRSLFNRYGGAELYPLTQERIHTLYRQCFKHKEQLNNMDQLLASPTRDFLLSSSGDKVPISSLKYKLIGLYLCENRPDPPHLDLIKNVYQEAKLRGYDFEIVQINFHFHHNHKVYANVEDLSVQQCYENINWLTLPFKDPRCRKLRRILKCDPDDDNWLGDCLVIVDRRQPDTNGVHFEFSGAEIVKKYGIEGYPFTRQSLFETERRIQKESVKLKLLFPPGECHLIRPARDGCDLIDGSVLSGKRVLVLFAELSECKSSKYVSMLESKYHEQFHCRREDESKFEVVYVSFDPVYESSSFDECIKDMPWLVYPYTKVFAYERRCMVFKYFGGVGVAAFDDGEFLAKKSGLDWFWKKKKVSQVAVSVYSTGFGTRDPF